MPGFCFSKVLEQRSELGSAVCFPRVCVWEQPPKADCSTAAPTAHTRSKATSSGRNTEHLNSSSQPFVSSMTAKEENP